MTLTVIYTAQAKSDRKNKRPSITGISNAAFFAKDVENTRQFYTKYLGFAEPISLRDLSGNTPSTAFIQVNERQIIEIYSEKAIGGNRLCSFAIATSNAQAMRKYLASKGVKVPKKISKGKSGELSFFVTDPIGTVCEIIQDKPLHNAQKNLPETRISTRMSHVGFMVPDLDKATAFYCDILGFQETWRGSKDGKNTNWVNLRVPEGNDYIELMLYAQQPSETDMGVLNHICLEVRDVSEAAATLSKRELPEGCKIPTTMKTGINRKRQINCYDIDGTRVEIMEANTVDGKLVSSSTAPPLKFVR
jgi:catechol 2,3-dioxygenase-like lactoylglutathione lyase family enzyme